MLCNFWEDFWPNFSSDILSGIIFAFIINSIINQLRRPKLDIVLTIASSVQNRRTLNFYCINKGKVGLMPNEIQWHLYFSTFFKFDHSAILWHTTNVDGEECYTVNGDNDAACLPNSSCLLISIDVVLDGETLSGEKPKFNSIDEAPFYYSLTTVRGEKKKPYFWKRDKETDFVQDLSFTKRRVFKIKQVSV